MVLNCIELFRPDLCMWILVFQTDQTFQHGGDNLSLNEQSLKNTLFALREDFWHTHWTVMGTLHFSSIILYSIAQICDYKERQVEHSWKSSTWPKAEQSPVKQKKAEKLEEFNFLLSHSVIIWVTKYSCPSHIRSWGTNVLAGYRGNNLLLKASELLWNSW